MKLDVCLRPVLLAVLSLLVVGGSKSAAEPEPEPVAAAKADTKAARAFATASLAKQPMRFETDGAGHVVGRAKGAAIALDERGATLSVRGKTRTQLSMHVAGGRDVAPVVGDELLTKINDLRGRDPKRWRKNVATFGKVAYPSVLDGVDLVYHGEQGQLEYDFIVAPGADPAKVAMTIEGGEGLSLTDAGDLAIKTDSRTIVQQRPRVYQRDARGNAHDVRASYRLAGDGKVAFNVADYDHALPLVIDPIIGWATFVGGDGYEEAADIALSNGNAYVAGYTDEYFGVENAVYTNQGGSAPKVTEVRGINVTGGPPFKGEDATVAKLDSAGRLVYVTLFGGSSDEEANSIAVDGSGRVYVTGFTASTDMKVTKNAAQPNLTQNNFQVDRDAFLFTLNDDGTDVTYATYLDIGTNFQENTFCPEGVFGCSFGYDDTATSLAVVDASHVYIGGYTENIDTRSVQPGGVAMAEDSSSTGLFVAAVTAPADGATDGVVTKKTFLGGGIVEQRRTGLGVVGTNLFFGGQVCADAVPTTPNGFQTTFHGDCDGYIAELDSTSLDVSWSSFLGAAGADTLEDLAVLPNGHVYVTGQIDAATNPDCAACVLPVTPLGNTTVQGSTDAYVAHIVPANGGATSLVWLRLFGGTSDDRGAALAVDPLGHAYVIGTTDSNDFPTTPQVPRNDASPNEDAFITEISADGTTNLLSTYYGGSDSEDVGTGIALGSDGVYVCGWSILLSDLDGVAVTMRDFPNTHSAAQDRLGREDEFVGKLQIEPLSLDPKGQSVAPQSQTTFAGKGGIAPYSYAIATLNTGNGSINSATGNYTAGVANGTDTIRVTDSAGNTATANITVLASNGGSSSSSSSGTSGGQATELVLTPLVTSVAPQGTVTFDISGGTPPYLARFATNGSNGSINAATGIYKAGPRGGVIDRIVVSDQLGQTKLATINVSAGITLTPATAAIAQNDKLTFGAAGGSGAPYTWTTTDGKITDLGEFTAPPSDVSVTITATDANGNKGTATVAVGAAIAIAPDTADTYPKGTVQFTAIGGAQPYVFTVTTANGGTVSADGLFTAGPTGGVDETVQVSGNAVQKASATVHVGPSVSITGAASLVGNTQTQLTGQGGSGVSYTFAIVSDTTGGASVDPDTGLVTAGPNAGEIQIKLTDSAGNVTTTTITVSAAPSTGSSSSSSGNSATAGTPDGGTGLGPINVASVGGDDSSCTVSNVGGDAPATSAFAGLGFALLLAARRRRDSKRAS